MFSKILKLTFLFLACLVFWPSPLSARTSSIFMPLNYLSLQNGLVGYWTFDGPDITSGGIVDKSGNGHAGRFVGVATSSAVTLGKIGQAARFTGTSTNYVVAESFFGNYSTYTITAWVKPDSNRPDDLQNAQGILVADAPGDPYGGYSLYIRSTDGAIGRYLGTFRWSATNKITFNSWNFIALREFVNISGWIEISNNGGPWERIYTGDTTLSQGGQPICIGNYCISNPTLNHPYRGLIDDLRVYNISLSADEIKRLYNSGSAKLGLTPRSSLTNGLVGHWTFDGPDMLQNVADRSGNSNKGRLVNFTSTSSALVAGKIGQGFKFTDYPEQYIAIDDSPSLRITGTGLTLSTWVKYPLASTSNMGFLAKWSSAGGYRLMFDWNDRPTLQITDGVTIPDVSAVSAVSKNAWHHIVGSYNGSKLLIYIDGVKDANETAFANAITPDATASLWLGHGDDHTGNPFSYPYEGLLDDVRIYNRALRPEEIKQLYKQGADNKISATPLGAPGQGLNSGLLGHWTFDGPDMLQNVADRSGRGNIGLMYNFTSTSSAVTLGKIGQALKYDGVDDYVNTVNPLAVPSNFSYSFWMKSSGGVSDGSPFSWGQGRFCGNAGGGAFRCTTDTDLTGAAEVSGTVYDNVWHHIVYVNVAGVQAIYKDGVKGTGATEGVYSTENTFMFGHRADASTYFRGMVDEARAYNRALSANEVLQLYNMGR